MRFLTLVLTILALQVQGQYYPDGKRDYNWCLGFMNTAPNYGGIQLEFADQNVSINYPDYNIPFFMTNVTNSDTIGSLMFFSNGFQIANKTGNIMQNGDSLSFGNFYPVFGNYLPDGALILP